MIRQFYVWGEEVRRSIDWLINLDYAQKKVDNSISILYKEVNLANRGLKMLDSGESRKEVIRPDFNRAIMIDFQGAKIT
jgi:hypothetical protein